MGPSEIAVVKISRTKYIMKCYHDMVDQTPPKRILWPWNQWESHCLHRRRPHIWNSRTSGASCYQNTGELPLEQKVNLHQVGDPIKRHADLFKYGYLYRMCRTRHFRWKGQCATEIQLLGTPHDRRSCRHASNDATLRQFDWHALVPGKKTGACTFATGGGGDSNTCHQDYVVPWQHRLRLLSIQALICFQQAEYW